MKKFSLLFVAMFALIGVNMRAVLPTVGSTYYFYNEATGTFINVGENKLAVAGSEGVMFTSIYNEGTPVIKSTSCNAIFMRFEKTGSSDRLRFDPDKQAATIDGTYYAKWVVVEGTDTHDGEILLTDEYDTSHSYAWAKGYLTVDGSTLKFVETPTENSYWKLLDEVSYHKIIDPLCDTKAALTAGADATFVIANNNFNDGATGWTVVEGRIEKKGSSSNPCVTAYNYTFDIQQKIWNMPQGFYRLRVQAFSRPAANDITWNMALAGKEIPNEAYIYANSTLTKVKNITDEYFTEKPSSGDYKELKAADDSPVFLPNNGTAFSTAFTNGMYENSVVGAVVADGILTVGVKNHTPGEPYAGYDNFRLEFIGTELPAADVAAVLADVPTGAMNGSVQSSLTNAVNAFKADVNAANFNALLSAIDQAKKSVEAYKAIQAALDANVTAYNAFGAVGKASYDNDVADIKAGLAAATISGDGTAELTAIENALNKAKAADMNPGDVVDIINADFENWTSNTVAPGWSGDLEKKSSTGNTCVTMNNGAKNTYQTIKGLHAGIYKLGVQAFSRPETSGANMVNAVLAGTVSENRVFMYGNDMRKNVCLISEGAMKTKPAEGGSTALTIGGVTYYMPDNGAASAEAFRTGCYKNTLYCIVDDTETLKIGITQEGNTYFGFDNFSLTYIGATFEAEDVAAVIADIPTGKMSATLKSALDAAVTTFQATPDVENYKALYTAIVAANASIKAYTNVKKALDDAEATAAGFSALSKTYYDEHITTYTTAYNNATIEGDGSNEIEGIKDVVAQAIAKDLKPGDDATFVIVNPSFEDWTGSVPTGWSVVKGQNSNTTVEKKSSGEGHSLITAYGYQIDICQKITGLKPGAYKVEVDASSRIGNPAVNDWTDMVAGKEVANYGYVYANGVEKKVHTVIDFVPQAPLSGDWKTVTNAYGEEKNGYVTHNAASAYAAFNEASHPYYNYIYCTVADDGVLTIGIKNEDTAGTAYIGFDNFRLTYLGDAIPEETVTLAVTDAKYATFIAPFDVVVPSGVEAYRVPGVKEDGVNLDMVKVTTIPANTPVVLYAESAVSVDVKGVNTATDLICTDGLLRGVYCEKHIPAGTGYVLQNQAGNVKFYQTDNTTSTLMTVPANHAYLYYVPSTGGEVKSLGFDAIATAIQNLKAAEAAQQGGIYNLNGQQLNGLQRGINIVGGKKVFVK